MIIINADRLQDGLYNVKDGQIFKYKAKGGTVRTYEMGEVVRCRDCIHWFPHTQCGFDEDNDEYHDYCGLLIPDDDYYAFQRKPDDYCSYGERRNP